LVIDLTPIHFFKKNKKNLKPLVLPQVPTRITIVNNFFPPDYAATGQLLEELAHHLKRNTLSVEIFTSQPSYAFDRDDAPRYERLKNNLLIRRSQSVRFWSSRVRGKTMGGVLFFLRSALYLIRSARRREMVLLTTAPPFLPILGYLLSHLFRIRYVCLLYDLYPDIAVQLGVIPVGHWLIELWNWFNCQSWKRSEAVIVISETMKHHILRHCPKIANKVFVIHNWANPDSITPIPKQQNWFARKHHLTDFFTVLYSGNMGRCHDMQTLIDAALYLQDEPIRFVFIGGGAKRQPTIDRVKALGLKNCLFLPYQDRATLPFSLTAGDVSIVSISAGMEGLVAPSKLYSALAAGRPVVGICEAHSYIKPLIEEAKSGAVFMNGDSIGLAKYLRHLSQDHQLSTRLGKAARKYCLNHFTPEKIAQDYLKVMRAKV
jgi:glycosyltransferase involved in cell wall biosynthesis